FFELFIASLYPLIFAVILVLGFYGFSWSIFFLIACKVLTASTIMIAVLSTTPYPALFRALGFIITPLLSSIMMLTYRSFFLLINIFTESYAIVRLRGGFAITRPIASIRNLAHIVSHTLLRAIELSEVQYEAMRLRGFSGKMYYTPRHKALPKATFALLCFVTVLGAIIIIAY
ncbi:MAG: energy-coupling factor transporter transmembrane component T, partial [bacterium]|nr:energy-coupling factor transporter transmembrane component T [bacterium]